MNGLLRGCWMGLLCICFSSAPMCFAWSSSVSQMRRPCLSLKASPGADIEQPPVEEEAVEGQSAEAPSSSAMSSTGRGKVNEIDFCIAPADVSLSRSYGMTSGRTASSSSASSSQAPPVMSLTRALNNASNRVVRRILLARSWPSAEALNESLRQVMAAEKKREKAAANAETGGSTAKCPVPRPILKVLTGRRNEAGGASNQPVPRGGRTDEEYVADQLQAFSERYGDLPGYNYAEAYLDSILSLATSGVESPRVAEVAQDGVYDEAYKRVLAVLQSVGAVLEVDPETGRQRIAKKLVDQDICLSMMDKIQFQHSHAAAKPTAINVEESSTGVKAETLDEPPVELKATETSSSDSTKRNLRFWKKQEGTSSSNATTDKDGVELTPEDLGGLLLSAEEPTMTRALNVLANIVQRALLFGGDQELLVLAETLDADRAPFVEQWYPNTGGLREEEDIQQETRPGVQFLNCLVTLLRNCYNRGVVTDLDPPLPLKESYANAYERLVASAVELGSGYLKPSIRADNVLGAMPKPRNAKEGLGQFALWESNFRGAQPDVSSYPEDLVGTWEVLDEIGGETIGMTTVVFDPQGEVQVAPPLEGLRWRLDPGPTHLDTCTFQVLGNDGTILQYRGFIDRGARLESRFSKRPITIRGSVMFQMREGVSVDYYRDILPVNYRAGTTKFVMKKIMTNKST